MDRIIYPNEVTMRKFRINSRIVPDRVIQDGKIFNIVEIKSTCVIKYFYVITDDIKNIMKVEVPFRHPNCNPDDDVFCLPQYLVGLKLDDQTLAVIESTLKTYHLASAYFNPWSEIKCELFQTINYIDDDIVDEEYKSDKINIDLKPAIDTAIKVADYSVRQVDKLYKYLLGVLRKEDKNKDAESSEHR